MIGGTKDWEWDVHSVWTVENQKAQEVRFTGKQDFERLHFELKIKKKNPTLLFLKIGRWNPHMKEVLLVQKESNILMISYFNFSIWHFHLIYILNCQANFLWLKNSLPIEEFEIYCMI